MVRLQAKAGEFATPYTCTAALTQGGAVTKLSALVMGLGNIVHGQVVKGLLFLLAEIAYVVFMIRSGFHNLAMLVTLGTVEQQEIWDEAQQVYLYTKGDQSILLLLYGLATIFLTVIMVWIWRGTLKSAYQAECLTKLGKHVRSFREDLKSLLDENIYRLFMVPSMVFISALTSVAVIRPQTAPTAIAIRNATERGIFRYSIESIQQAAATAPTEPMDRSISPRMSM